MPSDEEVHVPVKLDRVVELLLPALSGPSSVGEEPRWVVDGTLGMGGHAAALLRAAPEAMLLGIDRDPEALAIAERRLAFAADRTVLVHSVFDALPGLLGL